jgi:hypothetical protein
LDISDKQQIATLTIYIYDEFECRDFELGGDILMLAGGCLVTYQILAGRSLHLSDRRYRGRIAKRIRSDLKLHHDGREIVKHHQWLVKYLLHLSDRRYRGRILKHIAGLAKTPCCGYSN